MRKKYLFKSLLLLCALIAGASSSWAEEVTFTQTSTTAGTLAGAPAGVTATFSTTYSNMNPVNKWYNESDVSYGRGFDFDDEE